MVRTFESITLFIIELLVLNPSFWPQMACSYTTLYISQILSHFAFLLLCFYLLNSLVKALLLVFYQAVEENPIIYFIFKFENFHFS